MRLSPRLSHIPAIARNFRRLLLATLLSASTIQSGCVPYPLRVSEQTDSSVDASDTREGGMDSGNDAGMDASRDADLDAEIIVMPDTGIDANIDAFIIPMDASDTGPIDTGIDVGIVDSGDMRDTGTIDGGGIVDSGISDTGTGDSGTGVDAGSFTGPCTTSLTIGTDIVLPVTPSPGVPAPFGAAIGRDGRINVVHLAGGHLYFTSLSADGRTAVVPTADVNPDLATMETGNNIAIACSTVADQCIVPYIRTVPGDLVTVRINPLTGARIGTETVLDTMTNLNPYQIVYNQLNNTYGIVYAQVAGPTPYQAFISVTNSDGGIIRTTGLATVAAGTRAAFPTVTTLTMTSNYMVAFQDSVSGNNEIYVRRVNATIGTPAAVSRLTSTAAAESIGPSFRIVQSFGGLGEYRLDWIESGVNIYTNGYTSSGASIATPARLGITRADTATYIHSAEQFAAWNNASEFDIALFGETFSSVIANQVVEMSTFANFRQQVLSTGRVTAKVIFMNADGNLHIRDLSCL